MTQTQAPTVGSLLRDWRTRRRLSQLELAADAGISARHLSFVETGRARPSREMVLHIAEHLAVPLRERNALLVAAGYAPTYNATDIDAPELGAVRNAIQQVLNGHEPYPAILVDRRWMLVAANGAASVLVEGVAPWLLEPPINVLRASLHPEGLAPHIVNLGEWTDHIVGGLRRQIAVTGDEDLLALAEELEGYGHGSRYSPEAPRSIAIPLLLRVGETTLSFVTTIATFGTALDITLAELAIEAFLPADTATAEFLRAHAGTNESMMLA
jgi:transcriptional regulator with XRE-family HTH domain